MSFVVTAVRGNRPGKPVQLAEYEIKYLCAKAREIFINQPILLELEAPIKICGVSTQFYRVSDLSDPHSRPKATSMANITTFYVSLNTAVFHQKPTTSFLATT